MFRDTSVLFVALIIKVNDGKKRYKKRFGMNMFPANRLRLN